MTQLATQGPRGTNPYRRDYQSQEERSSADEKFRIINSSTGRLFYFELPNSNRKYKITFETRGNNDIKKLVYAAGMRFLDGNELLLANQWHARTRTEAEEDAIKELNDAKTNAISAINAEADRKNREIDSANLLPADVTKLKQQVEAAKTNGTTEVNRATSPQDVTTKKDTAVGAITSISLDEAKRNKAAKELNDAKTNAISAINDDGGQGDANNQDQPTTPSIPAHSGDSTDQATAPSAQDRETGNATAPESPQGLSGSSVTAPARSRRSVAFAGGAQSSQEKQVDKSVLRDLIQDLETRLKDLDGID